MAFHRKNFKNDFKTKLKVMPKSSSEISLFKEERDVLMIEADTLRAMLSSRRVLLYQKKSAPFTLKDEKLRIQAELEGKDAEIIELKKKIKLMRRDMSQP